MPYRLNHWKKAHVERVYLRGHGITGKAWLTIKGGKVILEGDTTDKAVLTGVLAQVGASGVNGETAWRMIVNAANDPAATRMRSVQAVDAAPAGYSLPSGGLHDFDIATIPIHEDVTFEVDHREPDGLFELLRKAPFANVVRASLSLGDVRINGNILIERKTVADFEASVIDPDKRLFNQAERLSFEPETLCFIIIEGDLYRQSSRMTMQQITGAFTYLSSIKGLSVIQVPDMTATAYTMAKIAQHSRHGLGYNLALRTNKGKPMLSARSYVLEGLPGVNATLAQRLLERFGSVAAVMAADATALATVEGIGKTIAGRIVEVSQGR